MPTEGISPAIILSIVAGYFFILLFVAWLTSRNSDNDDYFINGRRSQWWLVAIGMIGSSLSGVTFISIPVDPVLLRIMVFTVAGNPKVD